MISEIFKNTAILQTYGLYIYIYIYILVYQIININLVSIQKNNDKPMEILLPRCP